MTEKSPKYLTGGGVAWLLGAGTCFVIVFVIYLLQASSEYYLRMVRGTMVEGFVWLALGPLVLLTLSLCIGASVYFFNKNFQKLGVTFLIFSILTLVFPQMGYSFALFAHKMHKVVHSKTANTKTLMKDLRNIKSKNEMYFGSEPEEELKKFRQGDLKKILMSDASTYEEKKNAFWNLENIDEKMLPSVMAISKEMLKQESKYFDVYLSWPLQKIALSKLSQKADVYRELERTAISLNLYPMIIENIRSYSKYDRAKDEKFAAEERRRLFSRKADPEVVKTARVFWDADALVKSNRFYEAIPLLEEVWNGNEEFKDKELFSLLRNLVTCYSEMKDWARTVYYQQQFVQNMWGLQSNNEQIVKYWKFQEFYQKNGGSDPELLRQSFDIDLQILRRRVRGFGWYGSESLNLGVAAGYFYGKLRFKDAEHYLWLGVEWEKDRIRKNLPKRSGDEGEWLFREGLRNLFMIQGRYAEALEQQNWLCAEAESNPYKYEKRYHDYTIMQRQHEKEVIVYAKEHNLKPMEIIYGPLSQTPAFELDVPGWKNYDKKYQELYDRQAEEVLAETKHDKKLNRNLLIEFDQIKSADLILLANIPKKMHIQDLDLETVHSSASYQIPLANLWKLKKFLSACELLPLAQSSGWADVKAYAIELLMNDGSRYTLVPANGFGQLVLYKNNEKLGDYITVIMDFNSVASSFFQGSVLTGVTQNQS